MWIYWPNEGVVECLDRERIASYRRLGWFVGAAKTWLRAVALWKMEGYTHEEIAAKLRCVRFTVDRKLKAIRRIWDGERDR